MRNWRMSRCAVVLMALVFLGALSSYGQQPDTLKYPTKPVTFIDPITPGGPTDLAIRLIAKEAEKFLGQPVVVANKTGGAGSIGTAALAASKPDGYTIGYLPHSAIYLIPLIEKVSYNTATSFKQIMQFGSFNFGAIVKADSPFKSFKDLIEYARQNPKAATCGTTGPSSVQYLITEFIAKQEKVSFTHISFKGNPEMQTGLLGGHILFGVGDFNYSLVEAGRIRPLLLLKDEPSAEYPKVPILKDLGYEIACPMLLNIAAPKGTPDAMIGKLEDAFAKAMKEPAFIKGMKEDLRIPIVHRNSKELEAYVAHNVEVYAKLVRAMGLIK
ncbi:MAG: Bug family tripartite tricarboxylate transporter substrate binding protein [Thermodesulfobacteriota bacterium]